MSHHEDTTKWKLKKPDKKMMRKWKIGRELERQKNDLGLNLNSIHTSLHRRTQGTYIHRLVWIKSAQCSLWHSMMSTTHRVWGGGGLWSGKVMHNYLNDMTVNSKTWWRIMMIHLICQCCQYTNHIKAQCGSNEPVWPITATSQMFRNHLFIVKLMIYQSCSKNS